MSAPPPTSPRFARSGSSAHTRALVDLGLEIDMVTANDPFFGRGGRILAQSQRDEELKFEFVTPFDPDTPPVAIASSNLHLDHFGQTFGISTASGEVAHSTCLGWGWDRIVLALFRHHGTDPGAVADRCADEVVAVTSSPTSGRRPVLAIAHGESSVSAMKVAEAAESVCDLVWLVDSSELPSRGWSDSCASWARPSTPPACPRTRWPMRLRLCSPDGIIAFAEYLIPTASAMASRLGLEYHDSAVTRRLVDKFEQRQALRDGGLPVPRFVVIPPDPTERDARHRDGQRELPGRGEAASGSREQGHRPHR